jgi:hypothetical protein
MNIKPLRVLVACETSGRVREAFRARGHAAVSCDLLPADDGSPHHYQGDVLPLLDQPWDLVLAFPPCTHLCVSGARWWPAKVKDGRQAAAVAFFMAFTRLRCPWAIENPIGLMSTVYRKPDQVIQPWQFGHGETKATCLWLHRLPLLSPTNIVDGREARIHKLPPTADRWKIRSQTYQGIADAMADQWNDPQPKQLGLFCPAVV